MSAPNFFQDLEESAPAQKKAATPNFFSDIPQQQTRRAPTDFFIDIGPEDRESSQPQESAPGSFLERLGKSFAMQSQTSNAVTPRGAKIIAEEAPKLLEGATAGFFQAPEREIPEQEKEGRKVIGEGLRLTGELGLISGAQKLLKYVGVDPKTWLGRIGLGAGIGGSLSAGKQAAYEGKIDPKEVAKDAATWAALGAGLELINGAVQFKQAVDFISKGTGESKESVLSFLKNRFTSKFKGKPQPKPEDLAEEALDILREKQGEVLKGEFEKVQAKAPAAAEAPKNKLPEVSQSEEIRDIEGDLKDRKFDLEVLQDREGKRPVTQAQSNLIQEINALELKLHNLKKAPPKEAPSAPKENKLTPSELAEDKSTFQSLQHIAGDKFQDPILKAQAQWAVDEMEKVGNDITRLQSILERMPQMWAKEGDKYVPESMGESAKEELEAAAPTVPEKTEAFQVWEDYFNKAKNPPKSTKDKIRAAKSETDRIFNRYEKSLSPEHKKEIRETYRDLEAYLDYLKAIDEVEMAAKKTPAKARAEEKPAPVSNVSKESVRAPEKTPSESSIKQSLESQFPNVNFGKIQLKANPSSITQGGKTREFTNYTIAAHSPDAGITFYGSGESWEEAQKDLGDKLKESFGEPAKASEEQPAAAPKSSEETPPPRRGKKLDDAISFEPPKPTKPPKSSDEMTKPEQFRTAVIDSLYPLQRYVDGANIPDLPISENPYLLARLLKGWSGKAETFLEYKPFDPDTLKFNENVKGFKEIIAPWKEDLPALSKYLVAKRAIELSKQGKETGVDLSDAAEYLKNNTQFENASRQLKSYQKELLNYAQKSGLINPETKSVWETLNENYVPFQRVMDENPDQYFSRSMEPKQQFYELVGSQRQIIDPLESIIGNTYSIIRAAEQNRTLRSLIDFDKKHRANSFIEVTDEKTGEPTLKNFFDFLGGKGAISEDSFRYYDNGKMKTYSVPKEIADTLKGLTHDEIPFWGKIFSYPARAVRAGSITLSPGTVLKLAGLDQLEAFLYSDIGYVPYVDLVKGLFAALTKPEMYFQWKASGGDQALVRDLSRDYKKIKLSKLAGKTDLNEFKSLDGLLRAVEALTRPLEEATRLSVFSRSLARTGMTPDDLREAALRARTTTLDFAVRGARTHFITQAVPFLNPFLQGAAKFYDELKKNPKRLIPKAILALTLPTLALWLANRDRKEYQELPEWEKDKYWHFYSKVKGETLHLKLAKPYELGLLFATIPERIAEYAANKDKGALEQIAKATWDTMTHTVVPSLVYPLVQSYSNTNLFTGTPLVPEGLKRLPPSEQFQPYTTRSAKALGNFLAKIPYIGDTAVASPIQIQSWVDAWTGGAGSTFASYAEKALASTGVIHQRIDPEKEWADLPFFKSFFGHKEYTKSAASISRFYDEEKRLSELNAAINKARKEGRAEDVARFQKKFDPAKYKQAQRIRRAFTKNNQSIRAIQLDDENYTASEKKIIIDELVADMVGTARSFLGKEK